MLRDGFSTREVLQSTGATARQLQWWDEKRIIVPARDGRRRVYSKENLIELHVIEELRRKRISLPAVRRVLRFLRRQSTVGLIGLVAGKNEYYLLIDGGSLSLETEPARIVNLVRDSDQAVYLICLSEAARRVAVGPVLEKKAAARGKVAQSKSEKKPPASADWTSSQGGKSARWSKGAV